MRLNNKSGFTLLEIIIVVIIIGVLASLALPRLFSTVEFSRSAEAMSAFSSIRSSMDRCQLLTGDYNNCQSFSNLDMEDPANSPNNHFTYAINVTSTDDYTITAHRTTRAGGDGTSTIQLSVTATDVTRSGTGDFEGVQ